MTSTKEAGTSSRVVTGTLFLNWKPFCVLIDSGATHSVISTKSALQLVLEYAKAEPNYRIKLPNDCIVHCPILYKHVPICIGESIFLGNLI